MADQETDTIAELREKRREELIDGTEQTTPDDPITVNDQSDLQETVSSHDVVFVDFYADWCGPCQMLEPTLERVATNTEAVVAKVDIDQNQQLASNYGVQGVPNVVLFANGEPVKRIVGVRDEQVYTDLVDEVAN